MKLYGGIDLHPNNNVVALSDEKDRIVYRRRLFNEAAGLLAALEPYREAIEDLVVEVHLELVQACGCPDGGRLPGAPG